MPSKRQWFGLCEYAQRYGIDDEDRADLIERLVVAFDFQKAMVMIGIDCSSPMNSNGIALGSMEVVGHNEIFTVEPRPSTLWEENEVYVDFPDKTYEADIYAFYTVDKDDEPFESTPIGFATKRMLTHDGHFNDDVQDVRYIKVNKLWLMQKFTTRLKCDLQAPSIFKG